MGNSIVAEADDVTSSATKAEEGGDALPPSLLTMELVVKFVEGEKKLVARQQSRRSDGGCDGGGSGEGRGWCSGRRICNRGR